MVAWSGKAAVSVACGEGQLSPIFTNLGDVDPRCFVRIADISDFQVIETTPKSRHHTH